MFELNKKYVVEGNGLISLQGRYLIRSYMTKENGGYLPESFDWHWLVERGEFRGKFTKRVRAYLHKNFTKKFSDSFISMIGNFAKAHLSENDYVFDIVDRIDWRSGEFGDDGSCYWHNRSQAKDLRLGKQRILRM